MTLLILFIGFTSWADAAFFCVSNGTELLTAIQIANSNGEDDEIRLKNGDYFHPNQLPYYINLREHIEISGGWSDRGQFNCGGRVLGSNPMDTTIDGNNQSTVLFFTYDDNFPDVDVKISNLTLVNGYSAVNGIASGLQMSLPQYHVGEVDIDRVYFVGNHSLHRSAVSISRAAKTTIKKQCFPI
jgi:hypothetical protein